MNATMKAIVQAGYGGPEVLSPKDVPRPDLGRGEVLIRVRAAALNHADWVFTSGRPLIARLAFGMRGPRAVIRGKDLSGEVVDVGEGVVGLVAGDEVYAEAEAGAFAEYVSVPARLVGLKPSRLTFGEAASVPLSGRTALQALRDGADLKAGQRILINGASGGVGSFAVQIAKAMGAEVTGVCSQRNAALVRSLGADHVIDYATADFTIDQDRYDVILDLVGNHSLRAMRRVLTDNGVLVLASGAGGSVLGPIGRIIRALMLSPFVRHKLRTFAPNPGTVSLHQLRLLIESGSVVPAIDRTYRLDQVPEAMRYLVEEHARAKVVIAV